MGRKQTVPELGRYGLLALFVMVSDGLKSEDADGDCCRGIEHLELWGDAVKWGSEFKVNSSKACCLACKGMCSGDSGPCLCDSWVFCGDKQACGDKFGECWLKKQKDTLEPDRLDSGDHVMWTSGIVFGRGEGIIGLETEYGTLHLKLLPGCAPHSISYILDLLVSHHCVGCHFYRAESRGKSWDSEGNHIEQAPYGPPFALIQGTLGASGTIFEDIPTEACPTIRRGSVAWVESGPEFFISLANHNEWSKAYTVFGFVLPEDMEIVERIAQLPTKPEVWGNINVAVLENPVPLHVRRIKRSAGNQKLYTN
ncbi:hypothetical protein POPTR_014G051300v4 [Populus trichocarpa]|uniref:Uncharacterized protein n=1 Tax=Populus trichocarpa TaxID=3694 RepID=A0ACC0RZN2_POPTR|nr:uncharacterized protein LOC18105094 isoform X2 [Populus trichocarpa]KAI9381921.1 hypothetical protein POPTR_014G051300v4 [Populus trichocarpa]|eukprot:XP_024440385.1 uncharacterized protein LOC18105094 isoform X2 [Populus trichocarpa]